MKNTDTVNIDIISGVEGCCVSINDKRVAGPKPWGGGKVLMTWKAKPRAIRDAIVPLPKIICLCGSTRFIELFAIKTWELERAGNIVLGCTLLPLSYCKVASHFGEATGTKEQCDELHKRKIDLADEILVLNVGGYIGDSTRSEIEYATVHAKPISYLEPIAASAIRLARANPPEEKQ